MYLAHTPAGGTQPVGTPFPNNTTLFQRVDATATYRFDPTWVQQMGFKGDMLARLRYTWESNSVSNWQNDALAPFTDIPGYTANAIWHGLRQPELQRANACRVAHCQVVAGRQSHHEDS